MYLLADTNAIFPGKRLYYNKTGIMSGIFVLCDQREHLPLLKDLKFREAEFDPEAMQEMRPAGAFTIAEGSISTFSFFQISRNGLIP